MPVYHFSIRNRDTIAHRDAGREYPDLRSALADAHSAARAMIRHTLERPGPPAIHGSFDVEDEQRRPLARIVLSELARQLS